MKIITCIPIITFFGIINCSIANGQIFTKVTSNTNPIVTAPAQTFYNGASWIDYDNDNLLDLYIVRSGLFRNDSNGNFTKINSSGIESSTAIGNSWADVDNDGDIDCILSGGNTGGSKFFLNNGDNTFSKNSLGPFAVDTLLRGWGSAFGDYNNDGLVDLFIAAPVGFASITGKLKSGIYTLVLFNGRQTCSRKFVKE